MPSPTLTIDPADDLIDVPRRIAVAGLAPGERVTITAETLRNGSAWRSHAVFVADGEGTVELMRDAPVEGSYRGVAAMGLLWSQTPPGAGGLQPGLFHDDVAEPLLTSLVARTASGELRGELVQRLVGPGVIREEVREDGLVGVLFRPAGDPHAPAVVVLNGSGGGINEPRAALLAARGYNALALGYFNAPGLPRYISNTPLEYFETGLDWVRRKVAPRGGFVAVSGQSRGGELSLLLGATFPDKVSAVAGWVPSAFVHGGQGAADPAVGRDGPAWLHHGKPLVHIWNDNRTANWAPFLEGAEPRRNSLAMMTALGDPGATARARIPVERIAGPVLLVSGGDDGAWPSDLFSLMVVSSLAAAGHPHPVRWQNTPSAGHSILFPYVPTTVITSTHPVSRQVTTSGGTPEANAEANEMAWRAMLDWLGEATGR